MYDLWNKQVCLISGPDCTSQHVWRMYCLNVNMCDALVVVFCVCCVFSEKEKSLLPFSQSLFGNILRENIVSDQLSPRQCTGMFSQILWN